MSIESPNEVCLIVSEDAVCILEIPIGSQAVVEEDVECDVLSLFPTY